ncbi:MAG TPA: hypothetical protein VKZ89_18245 [Thermobifida alba]|nr:hypothetical protein [Thermobifida alba]
MGHKWIWPVVLGVIAAVLAGLWSLPRLLPGWGWGLDELNQLSGIASLAVAVAALVVAVWTLRSGTTPEGSRDGDSIEMSRVRTQGSVTGKSGPETSPAGDRIRMRSIRAGKDVVAKKTTQAHRKPSR